MTVIVTPPLSKRRYALLSVVAAILTIGLKFGAYLLTDSAASENRPTEPVSR